MFKNVASQKITVTAVNTSTGALVSGDAANLTVYVAKDDGTATVLTDTSATEVDATNAKGDYLFDLAQAETNADKLRFTGKSSTSNVIVIPQTIYTLPANFAATSIDSSGRVDVIKINGTSQTARDIGASVLLSSGTGTGQLDFTSGVVKANATQWLGGTIPAVNTAGVPLVDTKYVGGTLQTARDVGLSVLISSGTGTGQLSVTSGVVSANATQFAGQTITAAAGVTVPSSIASPTNITAGTITTVTNVTNAPTSGDFTTTMKTSLSAATPAVTVSDKTGFKLASDGLAQVTTWTVAITGDITGNLSGNVGSISGVTFPTNFSALGINASGHLSRVTLTDTLTTYTGNTPQTGDAFARIGLAGVGLTNLGDVRIAYLDASILSRMATFTYTTPLDAAGVRSALGMAAADLDDQLSGIADDAGGGSITIQPIYATTNTQLYGEQDLVIAQNSAPRLDFTCVDSRRSAIDLSAKIVRFVVATVSDATRTPVFQYQTSGSGITIGGTSSNVAQVQVDLDDTEDAGEFVYWLWNITDSTPLKKGRFTIEPSAKVVAP